MNDPVTILISFASALAALGSLLIAARLVKRGRPRLALASLDVGQGGLDLQIRNEGGAVALDADLEVSGRFDGSRRHVLHELGAGHVLTFRSAAPVGEWFQVRLRYSDQLGSRYIRLVELRASQGSPLRIVGVGEERSRPTFVAWFSSFAAR